MKFTGQTFLGSVTHLHNFSRKFLLLPGASTNINRRNCPTRYNDITALLHNDEVRRGSVGKPSALEKPIVEDDPFKVSTANGGPVPMTYVLLHHHLA